MSQRPAKWFFTAHPASQRSSYYARGFTVTKRSERTGLTTEARRHGEREEDECFVAFGSERPSFIGQRRCALPESNKTASPEEQRGVKPLRLTQWTLPKQACRDCHATVRPGRDNPCTSSVLTSVAPCLRGKSCPFRPQIVAKSPSLIPVPPVQLFGPGGPWSSKAVCSPYITRERRRVATRLDG